MKIETIAASNGSGDKSDVYRLLNIIHAMAGRCAVANIDGWILGETCTSEYYVMTVWTNGVVDIIAETWPERGERRYELRQSKLCCEKITH